LAGYGLFSSFEILASFQRHPRRVSGHRPLNILSRVPRSKALDTRMNWAGVFSALDTKDHFVESEARRGALEWGSSDHKVTDGSPTIQAEHRFLFHIGRGNAHWTVGAN
jgi:hypothetical protein